jgi:hypothetical protein
MFVVALLDRCSPRCCSVLHLSPLSPFFEFWQFTAFSARLEIKKTTPCNFISLDSLVPILHIELSRFSVSKLTRLRFLICGSIESAFCLTNLRLMLVLTLLESSPMLAPCVTVSPPNIYCKHSESLSGSTEACESSPHVVVVVSNGIRPIKDERFCA